MKFEIIGEDKSSKARIGEIKTRHGSFLTPVFIPVATTATIRALDNRDIAALGSSVIFDSVLPMHPKIGSKSMPFLVSLSS